MPTIRDAPLSRIPFRTEDELMIISMARWMRFIAMVTIVVGFIMLFVVLTSLVFGSMILSGALPQLRVKVAIAPPPLLWALGGFAILVAGLSVVSGFLLHLASDDFEKVARTDEADQDFLANGLALLGTYFKIHVAVTVLSFVVGVAAAASIVEYVARGR